MSAPLPTNPGPSPDGGGGGGKAGEDQNGTKNAGQGQDKGHQPYQSVGSGLQMVGPSFFYIIIEPCSTVLDVCIRNCI